MYNITGIVLEFDACASLHLVYDVLISIQMTENSMMYFFIMLICLVKLDMKKAHVLSLLYEHSQLVTLTVKCYTHILV